MKEFMPRFIIVSALTLIGWFAFSEWTAHAQLQALPQGGVVQWEYKVYERGADGPSEIELNKLGLQGWELVSTHRPRKNVFGMILKRPK